MSVDYYVMWLLRIPGIGRAHVRELVQFFGSAKEVFKASTKDLGQFKWISGSTINAFTNANKFKNIEQQVNEIRQKKISFISYYNENFPELLKHIDDPPVGLYYRGEINPDTSFNISMIGSRSTTPYGERSADELSFNLSKLGFTIVSGMAYGIDSICHRGALRAGGKTIAVLGSGVDICYPKEHLPLMNDIIANGCVMSEYPPGMYPNRGHFPVRNRLISGLSRGLIVVEAKASSGTRGTVDHALWQGRDVFAVPGNIDSEFSTGPNVMITEGAYAITNVDDVIDGLNGKTKWLEPRAKKYNNKNVASKTKSTKKESNYKLKVSDEVENLSKDKGEENKTLFDIPIIDEKPIDIIKSENEDKTNFLEFSGEKQNKLDDLDSIKSRNINNYIESTLLDFNLLKVAEEKEELFIDELDIDFNFDVSVNMDNGKENEHCSEIKIDINEEIEYNRKDKDKFLKIPLKNEKNIDENFIIKKEVASTIESSNESSNFIKDLDENEITVYNLIEETQTNIEHICAKSGLPINVVMVCATKLIIKKKIKQLPGQFYIRLK